MANVNIQMHKKNADGTYDNIYPKTKSEMVTTTDGSTVETKLNSSVPNTLTINNKPLYSNITLTASDVGAISTGTALNATTLNGYGTDNGSNSVLLSGRKAGTVIGTNSVAEGINTTASGYVSHAEGSSTTASGSYSHAEGYGTKASGTYTHAEGYDTTASGNESHAEGISTTASGYISHAQGQYNKTLTGPATTYSGTADAFVIGSGTSSSALSNAFRITFDGKAYGLSAFSSSGADYSEYFEWLDENVNLEDRAGHFVTLDGEKIKYANDGDYIVGIVSAAPAIIGDHPSESWSERWVKDIFGRIQHHDVDVPKKTQEVINPDGTTETVTISEAHTELQPIVNPDYDATKENEYENREKRPEWDTVGMLGKLITIDDGTCEANGYCKPLNGIATKSDAGYRVMARLDSTHIRVLIK